MQRIAEVIDDKDDNCLLDVKNTVKNSEWLSCYCSNYTSLSSITFDAASRKAVLIDGGWNIYIKERRYNRGRLLEPSRGCRSPQELPSDCANYLACYSDAFWKSNWISTIKFVANSILWSTILLIFFGRTGRVPQSGVQAIEEGKKENK